MNERDALGGRWDLILLGAPEDHAEYPAGGALGVFAVTSSVGPRAARALPPSMSISWESPQAEPWPLQGEVAACRNPKDHGDTANSICSSLT